VSIWFPKVSVIPGYQVELSEPCNLIELTMEWSGTGTANSEIQGTATLE